MSYKTLLISYLKDLNRIQDLLRFHREEIESCRKVCHYPDRCLFFHKEQLTSYEKDLEQFKFLLSEHKDEFSKYKKELDLVKNRIANYRILIDDYKDTIKNFENHKGENQWKTNKTTQIQIS